MVEDFVQLSDLVERLDPHYLLLFEVYIALGFKSEVSTFSYLVTTEKSRSLFFILYSLFYLIYIFKNKDFLYIYSLL